MLQRTLFYSLLLVQSGMAPMTAWGGFNLSDSQRRLMTAMTTVAQLRHGDLDRALVGDWRSSREVFSSNGRTQGEWLVRIDTAGRIVGILRGSDVFQIHAGSMLAGNGAWTIQLPNVQREIAAYDIKNSSVDVIPTTSPPYHLDPAGKEHEAVFAQVQALLRQPLGPDVSSWTMRAAEWARFWQPDARLVAVRMISLTDKALLGDNGHLEMTFDSAKAERGLSVSPGPLGGVISTVISASDRVRHYAQAATIPLPIVDLTDVVQIAGKAGYTGPFSSAQLTVRGTRKEEQRVIWWLQSKTNERKRDFCFDVASGHGRDCIALFGDPVVAYEELAKRAERARRAWSAAGSNVVPALSPYPESVLSSTPSNEPDWNAIERRRSAESNAYWSDDPTAHGRVATGTCTDDDRSRYGC